MFPDFTHTYDAPGVYFVKLTAYSYCGQSSFEDSVVVLPAPDSVQFVINDNLMCPTCPTDICLGESVSVNCYSTWNSHLIRDTIFRISMRRYND